MGGATLIMVCSGRSLVRSRRANHGPEDEFLEIKHSKHRKTTENHVPCFAMWSSQIDYMRSESNFIPPQITTHPSRVKTRQINTNRSQIGTSQYKSIQTTGRYPCNALQMHFLFNWIFLHFRLAPWCVMRLVAFTVSPCRASPRCRVNVEFYNVLYIFDSILYIIDYHLMLISN